MYIYFFSIINCTAFARIKSETPRKGRMQRDIRGVRILKRENAVWCAAESVHKVHTDAIAGRLSRNVNGTRANISVLFFFSAPDNCVWREAFSIHGVGNGGEGGRNTVCAGKRREWLILPPSRRATMCTGCFKKDSPRRDRLSAFFSLGKLIGKAFFKQWKMHNLSLK